ELFDAVGYIADKNFDKAYASLTEAMRSSGDAQRLFSTLYGHFRRLLYVSVTGVAMSAADMAKALKVKEGAIRIALSQSKKFSQRRLRAIVDKLGKAESSYKSGVVLADDAVLNGIFGILVE
ncbi:MAG: hypothetical protein J5903_00305, partial [Clostridia bacterium]|nr:hypothetical protein [Clostridia bacterium]